MPEIKEIEVTVDKTNDVNKYKINGELQHHLKLEVGKTYHIYQIDDSGIHHPLAISITADGTHENGIKHDCFRKVFTQKGTALSVKVDTPTTLYYYCEHHANMGSIISFQKYGRGFSNLNRGNRYRGSCGCK